MGDLSRLANALDPGARTCRAVVEAGKGSRGKYAYRPEMQAFELSSLLPEGMSYPCDFGFIPATRADDGDPTDLMLLADEPTPVGALVPVRLLGVIEAEQAVEGRALRNDRVIAIASVSHLFEAIREPNDLGERFWEQLLQFWVNYNALRHRAFRVLGLADAAAAVALVERSRLELQAAE